MAVILVIDDEAAMRRLIGRVLKRLGHLVQEAADGREGLELFRRQRPALVISDIVMPDGEGIETIRQIRRESPETPILAISGSANQSLYLRAATGLGASASLQKPFAPEELAAAVEELLRPPG
jgi:two-component system, chemotaxis family, chemotaxis protein CheY